jgi:hypothetical protein
MTSRGGQFLVSSGGQFFMSPDRASLFEPQGTSERITNETNKGQNRTDWASTEPYQYLDRVLPEEERPR